LSEEWKELLKSSNRKTLFRETRDRIVTREYPDQLNHHGLLPAIAALPADADHPEIVVYGFRAYDNQRIFRDTRLGDFCRPALWWSHSDRQIFLTSLFEHSLGNGSAVTFSPFVPDLHHFRGSYGGKDVVPLYRDAIATEPNITGGLLDLLSETYGVTVTPEDLAGYIAGVLGHPGYTERFHDELEVPGPRVPFTKDADLFQRAVELGKQVIAYQTYAERFPESIGTAKGRVSGGSARVKNDIPDDPDRYPQNLRAVTYDDNERELHVGEGVIEHVDPRLWAYEVSGLRVVRSWLGYRMRERSGRSSSPLDEIRPESWTWEMTKELLELLWVLEGVIALEPAQAELLDEIVAGELFLTDELPTPTEAERKAPRVERRQQLSLNI